MSLSVKCIYLILLVRADCKNCWLQELLVSLDIGKEFDSVEYYLMFKAMHLMGLSQQLLEWIEVLYTNANIMVMNNGSETTLINLNRGVRQGEQSHVVSLKCAMRSLQL